MNNDPTLQEIWDARQKIWEECGETLEGLLQFYQKLQNEHQHKMVRYQSASCELEVEVIP
jgi:hypothetical protein